MAPSSAAASNIAKLPPEVQAAIASLPYQDQEVFSYIALHDNSSSSSSSWSSALQGSSSSTSKKKGRAKNSSGADAAAAPAPASKMSDHVPSFVCACFVCYMAYWSLYDASPNKVAMDDAFALNDSLSLAAAEASSSSSSSTTSSPGQRSSSSPWGKRRGERGKAKKKCSSNRVSSSSTGSVDAGHQYEQQSPPPPPLSEYQHHRFDDQEERKRVAGKKAKDDNAAGVPSKPRSKQVAPFDFKEEGDEEEARQAPSSVSPESGMVEILEDAATGPAATSTTKPQSLGSRVSEAVCFVCEKLLGMWYPRLRRRNPAENR